MAGHHENYDGTGYPAGLCGAQLPLAARIVSVADAFEVMTAVRAYKRPLPLQTARAELARRSGTQFDPHVVRAFLNVSLGRVHWTLGVAAWVAEVPFLTIVPRVAAQLSTTAGAGSALSPVALPSIAAASLGAMVVVGHLDTSTTTPHHGVAAHAPGPPPAVVSTGTPSSSDSVAAAPTPDPALPPTPSVPTIAAASVTAVADAVARTAPPGPGLVTTSVRTTVAAVRSSLDAVATTTGALGTAVDGIDTAVDAVGTDVIGDPLGPTGGIHTVTGLVGATTHALDLPVGRALRRGRSTDRCRRDHRHRRRPPFGSPLRSPGQVPPCPLPITSLTTARSSWGATGLRR